MKKFTRKSMRKLQQFVERKGIYELPVINLKLYDVAFECEDNELFNLFCEDSYEMFNDMLEDRGLKTVQIGRASSFYIVPEYYENAFYNEEFDRYGFYESYIGDNLFGDMEVEKSEGISQYDIDIINKEVKNFKESIIDVIEVYKYIEEFKKNQLEIFNDWLIGVEEEKELMIDK